MARRGTVENALSAKALHDFCEHLASLPNLTLATMQKEAQKLGIALSHSAAGRFANGTFAEHLRKLQRAREFAEQVDAFNAEGVSGSLADTAAATVLQEICDLMASGAEYNVTKIAQAIATLQSGEHRRRELNAKLQLLEQKIKEYERRDREREERKAELSKAISKGLGKATLREIEEKIKLL